MWTREQAINFSILVESVCPDYGCHVALTGGSLYKPGVRKDCDILFYRIRQAPAIDEEGLFAALYALGVVCGPRHGWVQKATYQGKQVDMFFPEHDDATGYPHAEEFA